MAIDTYIGQAQTRVRTETEVIEAKCEAFKAFATRVEELPLDRHPTVSTSAAAGGTNHHVTGEKESHCRQVRAAFGETIRPHSVDDVGSGESLLETVRAEFTETIAVALAPTTDPSFTPALREMIVSEAERRRAEATALSRALDKETQQLQRAGDLVDEVLRWIVDADGTPLTAAGFDALTDRHETLASYRTRCETLARCRQTFLGKTTSNGLKAGVCHRQLVPYLYDDFPVDHPVLATVAKLDQTCKDCQRTVRAHLVRRG